MRHDRVSPWWRYIGPWPLQPFAAAVITWGFAAGISAGRLTASPAGLEPGSVALVFVRAALPAVALGLTLWAFRRFVPQVSTRLSVYLAAVASAAAVFVAVRLAMGDLSQAGRFSLGVTVLVALLRNLPIVLLTQAIIGLAGRRLQLEVERTQTALALSREHQRQLLDADERVRGQVSALLHDRVQAGLIAACLELTDVAGSTDDATRSTIDATVQRLENLRALDVRSAARALSPDLANTDLQSALEELAHQYAPAMLVTVEIDPIVAARTSNPRNQVLLGCFRIVEQAVLNAAVHGRARNCLVRVDSVADGLSISIQDDGVGIGAIQAPGLGSALTTTWTTMLGGSWNRVGLPSGGTLMTASLGSNSRM